MGLLVLLQSGDEEKNQLPYRRITPFAAVVTQSISFSLYKNSSVFVAIDDISMLKFSIHLFQHFSSEIRPKIHICSDENPFSTADPMENRPPAVRCSGLQTFRENSDVPCVGDRHGDPGDPGDPWPRSRKRSTEAGGGAGYTLPYTIWVNYNDLTGTSLGIMVYVRGIIPKWP